MNYQLERLASGSYDVLLAGEVVASLVKVPHSKSATWVIELLDEATRPAPFTAPEHVFPSLEDAKEWLGIRPDRSPTEPSARPGVGFPAGIELGAAA